MNECLAALLAPSRDKPQDKTVTNPGDGAGVGYGEVVGVDPGRKGVRHRDGSRLVD